MKYYIHFSRGEEGPFWTLQYAKECAQKSGIDMLESMEIRSEYGKLTCRSEFHGDWHDADTDPPAMIDLGEAGWFEEWE